MNETLQRKLASAAAADGSLASSKGFWSTRLVLFLGTLTDACRLLETTFRGLVPFPLPSQTMIQLRPIPVRSCLLPRPGQGVHRRIRT